ncbi:MAG: hypothetical protein QMD78_03665 [Methanocellales archaeon]|nr:hypothetical protein [Methanocellales archaeon]
MVSRGIAQVFVNEFVVGLGFCSGFWIGVGVNPETEILNALVSIIEDIAPQYTPLFYLIPVIFFILSILIIFVLGGLIGLTAVGSAFVDEF